LEHRPSPGSDKEACKGEADGMPKQPLGTIKGAWCNQATEDWCRISSFLIRKKKRVMSVDEDRK